VEPRRDRGLWLLLFITALMVLPAFSGSSSVSGQLPAPTQAGSVTPAGVSAQALSGSPTWSAESNQAAARFGAVVASAGDVNGDGYSDLLVGAPNYNDPNLSYTTEGRAYLYLGSAQGVSLVPAWTAGGVQSHFGAAVASAGDVNGDGFGDVVVGEPDPFLSTTPGAPPSYQGQVSIYLGSSSGLSSTPSLMLHDGNFARFGASVAPAGDVNGDGFGDLIIGAPGQTRLGQAFVYPGSASGLPSAAAWVTRGDSDTQGAAQYGNSVAGAGDVNGDGFSDVIVGEPGYYGPGGCQTGRAFVYFGSAQGLSTTPGWVMDGDAVCLNLDSTNFGNSVASAGDVNGDGFSDILISGAKKGTLLFLGSPTGPSRTFPWNAFGVVRAAGDVNGDHYGDVIRGNPLYTNGQTNEGAAFIYLGSPAGLSGTPAWVTESDQASSGFGSSVASAGDTDGDGLSNVVVGAPLYDDGELDEGAAFQFFGVESIPYFWTYGIGSALICLFALWIAVDSVPSPRRSRKIAIPAVLATPLLTAVHRS